MTPISNIFEHYAFISLGANLNSSFGSPRDSIKYATAKISTFSSQPLLISSLFETKPLDCPPNSPDYVNSVVGFIPEKSETPLSLLYRLQAIEDEVGRTRSGLLNEARVLDLDLITFKNEHYESDELIVPHPRAYKRKFVLGPLMELSGNQLFPGQDILISELIAKAF